MMIKTATTPKNVYELAQERLRIIFNEFDNVYLSFSGGKDSGVLLSLCIDYIRKNNLKIKLGVFHMDYEIQYKMTIHVSVFLASVGGQQKGIVGTSDA